LTVASPLARRARIARRVGSAKAEKAESRFSPTFISKILYKCFLIVNERLIAGG
jgi:chorismate mutase